MSEEQVMIFVTHEGKYQVNRLIIFNIGNELSELERHLIACHWIFTGNLLCMVHYIHRKLDIGLSEEKTEAIH